MSEHTPLEDCPFCGSPAEYLNEKNERHPINRNYACCSFTGCKMHNLFFTVKHWNSRPTDKLKSENRRLREALEATLRYLIHTHRVDDFDNIPENCPECILTNKIEQALNESE